MCIDPKPISVGKERQIESTMDKDSIQVTNQSSGNEGPVSLATSLVMLLSHPKKQLQEHEAALTRGSVQKKMEVTLHTPCLGGPVHAI